MEPNLATAIRLATLCHNSLMDTPSVFTRIINGELPCHKIYEDSLVLAFLDIQPVTEGQTVVVPKKQIQFVWDLDDEYYQALMTATKKIGAHLRDVLKTKYVGVRIEGAEVPHAHVKLYPSNEILERGTPDRPAEPDHSALAELAKKLAF